MRRFALAYSYAVKILIHLTNLFKNELQHDFSKLLKIQVLVLFCVQQAWVFHLFGFIWPVVVEKLRQLNWSFGFRHLKTKCQ